MYNKRSMNMTNINTLIFDMDGTILDTIDDIAMSVNYILSKYNMPTRSVDEVKSFVGNGLKKTLERSVEPGTKDDFVDSIYNEFTDYYRKHSNIHTRPYDGIVDTIKHLKNHGYKLALVSNKRQEAVEKLCDLMFTDLFDVVMGDSENNKCKPDPDMIIKVLNVLGSKREEAVYIGDSDVDVETARNSALSGIFVSWGFRDKEFLLDKGAECIVDSCEELIDVIMRQQ